MFQTTVTPKSNKVHFTIPADLVGKEIEIIVYPKEKTDRIKRNKKFESIMEFYSRFNFPSGKKKFTREELHER